MDCSLPGSSTHGIFQARVLEWGAIAFSVSDTKSEKKKGNNQIRMTTSLREQQEWDAHNSHMRVIFGVDQPGFG